MLLWPPWASGPGSSHAAWVQANGGLSKTSSCSPAFLGLRSLALSHMKMFALWVLFLLPSSFTSSPWITVQLSRLFDLLRIMKQMSTDTCNQPGFSQWGEMSTEAVFGCNSWLGYHLHLITCSRWTWADWKAVTWGELWKAYETTCMHSVPVRNCLRLTSGSIGYVKSGNAWISAATAFGGIVETCNYTVHTFCGFDSDW